MSEKTEAEWGALAARLAQEVMGCLSWDGLTDEQRMATLAQSSMSVSVCENLWWSWNAERGRAIALVSGKWQPHLDIAQAMMVKDKIVAQRWWFDLHVRPVHYDPSANFWRPAESPIGGFGKTDAKAICEAAVAWLDREAQ